MSQGARDIRNLEQGHCHPAVWRILTMIGGLYVTQSIIGALSFQAMPAVMRAAGVDLDKIGLVSLLMLPWMLKILWAQPVERWRIPAHGPRRSRQIILIGQGIIAICLLAAACWHPDDGFMRIFVWLALAAVISATVDIACDGFAIEQLLPAWRGWGNTMQVGGAYLGMMVGGGGFMLSVDLIGWSASALGLAVITLLLTGPFLLVRKPRGVSAEDLGRLSTHFPARASAERSWRPSLRAALIRRDLWLGVLVVVIAQGGLRMTQAMVGPYLIDRGMSLGALGLLSGTVSSGLALIGSVIGGPLVARFGASRILIVGLVGQAVVLTGFGLDSMEVGGPLIVSQGLLVMKSCVDAICFVALYTAMMGWSSPHQAGVDFTLFQCADAAVAAGCGLVAGMVAQSVGYAVCFALGLGITVVAIAVVPILFRWVSGFSVSDRRAQGLVTDQALPTDAEP